MSAVYIIVFVILVVALIKALPLKQKGGRVREQETNIESKETVFGCSDGKSWLTDLSEYLDSLSTRNMPEGCLKMQGVVILKLSLSDFAEAIKGLLERNTNCDRISFIGYVCGWRDYRQGCIGTTKAELQDSLSLDGAKKESFETGYDEGVKAAARRARNK